MDLPLKCRCGSLRGTVRDPLKDALGRIICLCDDCQAYLHFLKRTDLLDRNGGSDIFPVGPAKLSFSSGALQCLRLTPRGMNRWFAACCKTPVANTMAKYGFPHAGMSTALLDTTDIEGTLGPVRGRVQGKFGIPPLPPDAHRTASLPIIAGTIRFLAVGWLKHQQGPSPFFDSRGRPTVEPYVLTSEEREALRKFCGPTPTCQPAR